MIKVDLPKSNPENKLNQNQEQQNLEKGGQTILFRYKRRLDEIAPQEICSAYPSKRIKMESEEQLVTRLFNECSLEVKPKCQFVLQRVKVDDESQEAQNIRNIIKQAQQASFDIRSKRRQEIFQNSYPRSLAQRKIRIVRVDKRDLIMENEDSIKKTVKLGNQIMQYQQIMQDVKYTEQIYKLERRLIQAGEIFPKMSIEANLFNIDYEEQNNNENKIEQDEEDSNRSDNPNYDYPQEDESRSSEQIIDRDDSDENGEYSYHDGEQYEEDEEELYRQYLKRCKKHQKQMDMECNYQEYD